MKDGNVRWGVLSTAKIAEDRMIPAIKKTSGTVYAVASRDEKKGEAFAEANGIERIYGSYGELIGSSEVDAIYCPLPTGMHKEWALKCAEVEKPLLCEKPLTVHRDEAVEVFEAFEKTNTLISEAYMYLYHPLHKKVMELIAEGRIGELRSIRSNFNINIPRTNIRYDRKLGGGALLDLGCYCVGISRMIAGSEPEEIHGVGNYGKTDVDETFAGCLKFPSGVLATFCCALESFFDCSYEVFGTEGRIRVAEGGMVVWPDESFDIECWHGEEEEILTIPPEDHYRLLVEDFHQTMNEKGKEVVPHSESLNNLKVMDVLRGV